MDYQQIAWKDTSGRVWWLTELDRIGATLSGRPSAADIILWRWPAQ